MSVSCHFSPVAFNILSLTLIFVSFDYYVSWCVPPWVYPAWDSLCFLDLVDYFLSHVREIFSYYLFKCFLGSFLSSPSGTPIMRMLILPKPFIKKKLMTKRPPNAFSLPLTGKKKKKVKKYCLTEIQKTLYFIPNKLLVKNLSPNICRCLSMVF